MRVLLVHAEFPVTYWGFQYSLPLMKKGAVLPPLGLASLAAILPRSWELRLVDANVAPVQDEDLLWADAVLVGGMLVQAPSMQAVVRRAKQLGKKTMVGGPAATASPALFSEADHVFQAEAEGRTAAISAALERGGPKLLSPPPGARPDLAGVPPPRYDLLDLSRYRSAAVQTSRGCPFTCEFCDIVATFGNVPRVKTPAQVLAELDSLLALGWRGTVFIVDDNFIGNKKAVRLLLPHIERWQEAHDRPFTFYTEASVNLAADPALLAAMIRAGFDSVFLGIETPSPETLRATHKTQNAAVDLSAAVETITRAGLEVMGGFIVGFDGDTKETFAAQRDFIRASPIPLAMVGVLTALPGTDLWARLAREGRLLGDCSGDQFGRPNFVTAMGEETLLSGYARLMRDLYTADAYYARAEAVIDRIGIPESSAGGAPSDYLIALRAVARVGLGDRRRHFWRLAARAGARHPSLVRRAIALAVQGEHMIRYTAEHVLPALDASLAQARKTRPKPDRVALPILAPAAG